MESIKAIQSQNIYRVNPINLFEKRKKKNNIFAQNYNLFHPQAKSPTTANYLDILA